MPPPMTVANERLSLTRREDLARYAYQPTRVVESVANLIETPITFAAA